MKGSYTLRELTTLWQSGRSRVLGRQGPERCLLLGEGPGPPPRPPPHPPSLDDTPSLSPLLQRHSCSRLLFLGTQATSQSTLGHLMGSGPRDMTAGDVCYFQAWPRRACTSLRCPSPPPRPHSWRPRVSDAVTARWRAARPARDRAGARGRSERSSARPQGARGSRGGAAQHRPPSRTHPRPRLFISPAGKSASSSFRGIRVTHLDRTPRRKRDFNAAVGGDSGTSHSTEGPSTIVSDQDSQAQLSRFVARVMPTSDTGWEQSRGWQTGRRASAEGSGARRPPRLLPRRRRPVRPDLPVASEKTGIWISASNLQSSVIWQLPQTKDKHFAWQTKTELPALSVLRHIPVLHPLFQTHTI